MAAETTTVRVRRLDSERLQSLAKARQTPVVLRGLTDYQRLRDNPELWKQHLAEREEWDALA